MEKDVYYSYFEWLKYYEPKEINELNKDQLIDMFWSIFNYDVRCTKKIISILGNYISKVKKEILLSKLIEIREMYGINAKEELCKDVLL